MILLNAFSLNMVKVEECSIKMKEISLLSAKEILMSESVKSYVGHSDTCGILSSLLGVEVVFNRSTFYFDGDNSDAIVAQYNGPRLPEGSTELPEGASFKFFMIKVR